MNIGIVGCGVVGEACAFGFEKLGHTVLKHDTKWENSALTNVLPSDVVFICVPTPSRSDNSCDTTVVKNVVKDLCSLRYEGVIAIKSTVTPGTTEELIKETGYSKICFIPEFLRERCAVSDFVEHHDLLAIGSSDDEIYNLIEKIHGSYPQTVTQLSPTEAEFLKYFSNAFNAMKIIFANEFYELCNAKSVDYKKVKDAYIMRGFEPDMYLDVNHNFRGYGGVCLPKDVKTLSHMETRNNKFTGLFSMIDQLNLRYEVTVPGGMRK